MDESESGDIRDSLQKLAGTTDDSLRASQDFMRSLTSISFSDQEQAVQYALGVFMKLVHPQRVALLQTIRSHLDQNDYSCLAISANKLLVIHVLNCLERELNRTKGLWRFKKPAHGPAEDVGTVTTLIGEVRERVKAVSIEEKALNVSPGMQEFVTGLNDSELGRLIRFVREMSNIKGCRNREPVVSEEYLDQRLERSASLTPLFQEELHFLQPVPDLVSRMAQMDFAELGLLADFISQLRAKKSGQGVERIFDVGTFTTTLKEKTKAYADKNYIVFDGSRDSEDVQREKEEQAQEADRLREELLDFCADALLSAPVSDRENIWKIIYTVVVVYKYPVGSLLFCATATGTFYQELASRITERKSPL